MPVESEIEVTLKFSTEGDKTDTLAVKSITALDFLGSVISHSFQREICSFNWYFRLHLFGSFPITNQIFYKTC